MIAVVLTSLLLPLVAASSSDWMTVKEGLEFQGDARRLSNYVDGTETFYADYAQAWRYLGFYVDCDPEELDYEQNGNNGQNNNNNNANEQEGACQRYILWASYVDMDYKDNGIADYQYFDVDAGKWDSSACMSGTRCARMDCHDPNSNFKLLGFFKQSNIQDFFQSLGEHQASCVVPYSDFRQTFQNEAFAWPEGCVATGQFDDETGQILYLDLKPASDGKIDLGLYKDARCSQLYLGDKSPYSAYQNIYGANGGNNKQGNEGGEGQMDYYWDASSSDAGYMLEAWNKVLDRFSVCQPCRGYNLQAIVGGQSWSSYQEYDNNWAAYEEGQQQQAYNGQQQNNGNYNYQPTTYQLASREYGCTDMAGLRNVNQCAYLASDDEGMRAASFQDVVLAAQQGSIHEVKLGNKVYGGDGTAKVNVFFIIALVLFFGSLIALVWRLRKNAASEDAALNQSLLPNDKAEQA